MAHGVLFNYGKYLNEPLRIITHEMYNKTRQM